MHLPHQAAKTFNSCCACQTLDADALIRSVESQTVGGIELPPLPAHMFAAEQVFLSQRDFAAIQATVDAVESVVRQDAWVELVKPDVALEHFPFPKTQSIFTSYDFHIGDAGPGLIEINTNAGGALLAAEAALAHRTCCTISGSGKNAAQTLGDRFVEMIEAEWQSTHKMRPLQTIAIVDNAPEAQHLYPEFLIAQKLLREAGYEVVIADASELTFSDGRLLADGVAIDLVYNRCTDFDLSDEKHSALRRAAISESAVITPHPWHHALLADKRNLVRLTDPEMLDSLQVGPVRRGLLAQIPQSRLVTPENADALWEKRKDFYFKPWGGHAAKGVYRGAKLTRRVWQDIVSGGYIAQQAVTPSSRRVRVDGADEYLKMDIRAYTYGREILFLAARLYSGQTTNMRTPGGGFAPVVIV